MRRFTLERSADISGVSGVGSVAEGVEFTDGFVVLRWKTHLTSTAVYNSMDELMQIHGHDGATVVEWLDKATSCWPHPGPFYPRGLPNAT